MNPFWEIIENTSAWHALFIFQAQTECTQRQAFCTGAVPQRLLVLLLAARSPKLLLLGRDGAPVTEAYRVTFKDLLAFCRGLPAIAWAVALFVVITGVFGMAVGDILFLRSPVRRSSSR